MKMRTAVPLVLLGIIGWLATSEALQGRREGQLKALEEPFVGVTSDGKPVPGLYEIHSSGVSTEPVKQAADAFLAGLTDVQRSATTFSVDSTEWRDWHNVHRAPREGVSFGEMSPDQRELALSLFAASLSAKGLQKTKNVMRLNEYLAELVGKHDEYGEEFYFVTVMGEPSTTKPWGWQLDGHHLVINYFVLGDQVVLSPSFMGSEPVVGAGEFAGIAVMQDEQDKGPCVDGGARRGAASERDAGRGEDPQQHVGGGVQRQPRARLRWPACVGDERCTEATSRRRDRGVRGQHG